MDNEKRAFQNYGRDQSLADGQSHLRAESNKKRNMPTRRDLLKLALAAPVAGGVLMRARANAPVSRGNEITPQFLPYSPIWKGIELGKTPILLRASLEFRFVRWMG